MIKELIIVTHLQKNVKQMFGKHITTATDCEVLANLISQKCNTNISSQTLRRFFGLIKSASASSKFTLDLLSKFCGFLDFKDFSHSYSTTELELFFANTDNNDESYWRKSEQLSKQIAESPELLVSTHHRLMSFPMARKYFIENHPSRDLICTVYSEYFQAYLKYNTSNEAKIFAYGFLFQSAFLHQNLELMELYFRRVKETELTDEVHVIPAGLKYGVQLLYADFTGNEYLFRKYFAEMKKTRLQYIHGSEHSVCSFEYTVLESLIFTNRIKAIKFLLDNNTCQKSNDQSFIPAERKETHEQVWNILCAAAYQKLGNDQKSAEYFDRVNLDNLGIGWKKYYSIIYYFTQLNQTVYNQTEPIISKLKTLIGETYFSYYQTVLDDFKKTLDTNKHEEKKLHAV